MVLHKKFLEGRIAPDVPIESIDSIDWYNEMAVRSFEGFSYKGTRITGDHFFFLNFFPMMVSILDSRGFPTKDFEFTMPFYSQDDDYLLKQFEEAEQDGMAIFLFTGRAYGKTYLVSSIPIKLLYFKPRSHSVISASGDDHANETWSKLGVAVDQININHPAISQKFLFNSSDRIESGEDVYENNVKNTVGNRSVIEKRVYDKKPGKTKGRRLDYQQFEEVGDWGGAATLKECIGASEGSWKVGSIIRCRVFYTGTGGTVKSHQAKELFYNPEAFNIYPVKQWSERSTGIFIPAFIKTGGFWEKTGISDKVGARAYHEEQRELKKSDKVALSKYKQEFPFTPEEAFTITGGNNYDQELIAEQMVRLQENYYDNQGERGYLDWVRKDGKAIGVKWFKNPNGKIWILEHPHKMQDGKTPPYLYISGLDGIDLGEDDSVTTTGSNGALSVKKRMLSSQNLNNAYVCHYIERPNDIDVFYDTCLMISVYYNSLINIEYSKVGIVGYFKRLGEYKRFMKRPRLTLTDPTSDGSKLIGVTPTVKNFEYGETFFARYVKDYWENLRYLPALEEARDFSAEFRTQFDLHVSMQMCELGDDELMDQMMLPPKVDSEPPKMGYYTDQNGIKRWGVLPIQSQKLQSQFNFNNQTAFAGYLNEEDKY